MNVRRICKLSVMLCFEINVVEEKLMSSTTCLFSAFMFAQFDTTSITFKHMVIRKESILNIKQYIKCWHKAKVQLKDLYHSLGDIISFFWATISYCEIWHSKRGTLLKSQGFYLRLKVEAITKSRAKAWGYGKKSSRYYQ